MEKRFLLGLLFLLAASARADISWFANANPILGPDDRTDRSESSFSTALLGNRFDAASGYLVQLVYAGADGLRNAIPGVVAAGFEDDAAYGAQGDDVVVATHWVGAGRPFNDLNGKFNAGDPFAGDVVGKYFIRAWAGVSQEPSMVQNGEASAQLPAAITDGAGDFWWYGDSELFDNPGDGAGAPMVNLRDFTAAGSFLVDQLVTAPAASTDISITQLEVSATQVLIEWDSEAARQYDVEVTDVLSGGSWSTVAPNVNSGGASTFTTFLPGAAVLQIYRVVESEILVPN